MINAQVDNCRFFAQLLIINVRAKSLLATAVVAAAGGFALSGCSPSPDPISTQASAGAQRSQASAIAMRREFADRFPGATILGEAEFADAVVGGSFRYGVVGSEIVQLVPKEIFVEGGLYRIHWTRTISYGTWSLERGIVSIDCPDCPYSFLGLDWQRVFFRHQSRLLMANADGAGGVIELIEEPLGSAPLSKRSFQLS